MARLRFDPTPNPNAFKVTVPAPFCNGSRIISTKEKAKGSPIAEALLSAPGVVSLFFLNDFVTVTKAPDADWDAVLPHVKQALETHPHFVP